MGEPKTKMGTYFPRNMPFVAKAFLSITLGVLFDSF